MATRRKKNVDQTKDLSRKMQAHIQKLGLRSVTEYKKWCRQHQLPATLGKRNCQLNKECLLKPRIKADRILCQNDQGKDLMNSIRGIY